VELRPLSGADAAKLEPWYQDGETQRRLDSDDWPRRLLGLLQSQPGTRFRGHLVTARWAWVAQEDEEAIALVDVEVYDASEATVSLCVAPEKRGQGYGRRALVAALRQPELVGLTLAIEVEPDNLPALGLCQALGLEPLEGLTEEGFRRFRGRVPAQTDLERC
jgi:ribosomal protein S18 acetylase RimI-like enzyme